MSRRTRSQRPAVPRPAAAAAARVPAGAPAARTRLVHVLLIVAAAVLVYSNTLQNEFHLDDFYRVVDNPGIQKVAPVWRHFTDPSTSATLERVVQYRPLLPLTLSLNYAFGGENVLGYHIVNVLLQIVASVLVYFLVLELLRYPAGPPLTAARQGLVALAVAALFAVHPVSGIAVNYISARDLLLMQAFLLGFLLAYVRMRRKGSTIGRWALVLLLLALSMLSKQNGVVAPLLVLAFEFTLGREQVTSAAPWLRALPPAAVIGAFFLYTGAVLGFSDTSNVLDGRVAPPLEYPLTQARLHLLHYIRNFLWPFFIRQAPLIEPARSILDPLVMIGGLFIVATVVIAWKLRERLPLVAFCVVAYWLLMAPESSVLRLHHFAVDYRPYPSSIFLFLPCALLLGRYDTRLMWASTLLVVAYAGTASYLLNRTWRTEEALWSHSVRHGGDALAHLNLAMSIADREDPRVRRHLEEAIRLNPGYILAHINLGLWLIEHGEADTGLNHVLEAVASDPERAQSHYWLAAAYRHVNRVQDAAAASTAAVRLEPRNWRYRYQAALDAQAVDDYAGSLEHIAALERLAPNDANLGFMKGFALRRLGRLEEAIAAYRTFLTANPEHAQAQFNLGYALLLANRCEEAIPPFETALRLNATFSDAHVYLATCYDRLGRPDLAAAHRARNG